MSFMPGVGAGASGPQINLLLGRGERFVILLDGDKKGKEAAKIYKETWYLPSNDVATLADIDIALDGKRLEDLLGDETLQVIKNHFQLKTRPSKKQMGLYFAEMCATNALSSCVCSETKKNITSVIEQLAHRL